MSYVKDPFFHFLHTPEAAKEVTGEVGTKVGLSRDQVRILHNLLEDQGITDLMAISGRKNRTKFRDQVLNPLIDAGLATMTIPNRPRSGKQRYRLTEKGREWLDSYRKGIR